MRLRAALFVLVIVASCAGKYEDQFGRVYDWKKEGFSEAEEVVATKQGLFLVTKHGFSVLNSLGTRG
jgi:hypothetical protein